MASSWTPERDKTLTEMLRLGYSYTEIGERIDMTRNAIAGRANRLGLVRFKMDVKKDRSPPVPLPVVEPPPPDHTYRSLVDLPRWGCRWPMAMDDDVHLFCGADAGIGNTYCAEHHKISYRAGRS